MEVSYTLTQDDLRAYLEWGVRQPAVQRQMDASRLLGSAVFVLIAAIFALGGALGARTLLLAMSGVVLLFAVLAWFTLAGRMRSAYVRRSLAALTDGKTGYLLGPRTARISSDGFALSGPGVAASYGWEVVDHVGMGASGVYVFLGAQQAHVVPRSAFASFEEMERFASEAEAAASGAAA